MNQSWFCTFNKQMIPFVVKTMKEHLDSHTINDPYLLKEIEAKKKSMTRRLTILEYRKAQ